MKVLVANGVTRRGTQWYTCVQEATTLDEARQIAFLETGDDLNVKVE